MARREQEKQFAALATEAVDSDEHANNMGWFAQHMVLKLGANAALHLVRGMMKIPGAIPRLVRWVSAVHRAYGAEAVSEGQVRASMEALEVRIQNHDLYPPEK